MILKPKHINLYMDQAKRASQESYAKRLKVGCIIVKNDNIISMSWNGTPPGWANECENDNITRPEVYHAEESAILKLASSHESSSGATIFVTHSPCLNCARMIARSGIISVYYGEKYRDTTGIDFLDKFGVEVNYFPTNIIPYQEISNNLNLQPSINFDTMINIIGIQNDK